MGSEFCSEFSLSQKKSKKKKAPSISPWPDVAFINVHAEIFTSESCSDRPQMCPVSSDEAEHGKIITMEKLCSGAALPTSILLFFLLAIVPFHCRCLLSQPSHLSEICSRFHYFVLPCYTRKSFITVILKSAINPRCVCVEITEGGQGGTLATRFDFSMTSINHSIIDVFMSPNFSTKWPEHHPWNRFLFYFLFIIFFAGIGRYYMLSAGRKSQSRHITLYITEKLKTWYIPISKKKM